MELKNNISAKIIKAIQSQAFYNSLGIAAIKIMWERTRSGVDIDGNSMGEYSEPYKKVRERHNLPTHPVTMTFSDLEGMMSNKNLEHVVANDFTSVSVMFHNKATEQIAYYWNVAGAGRKRMIRKFWGITQKSELDKLAKIGFDYLVNVFKNFKG